VREGDEERDRRKSKKSETVKIKAGKRKSIEDCILHTLTSKKCEPHITYLELQSEADYCRTTGIFYTGLMFSFFSPPPFSPSFDLLVFLACRSFIHS